MYFYLSAITSQNEIALVELIFKHFPQLFALDLHIALKQKWHCSLSSSIITTKLDIYVHKYKDDYICKGLLQAIFLVTINI